MLFVPISWLHLLTDQKNFSHYHEVYWHNYENQFYFLTIWKRLVCRFNGILNENLQVCHGCTLIPRIKSNTLLWRNGTHHLGNLRFVVSIKHAQNSQPYAVLEFTSILRRFTISRLTSQATFVGRILNAYLDHKFSDSGHVILVLHWTCTSDC